MGIPPKTTILTTACILIAGLTIAGAREMTAIVVDGDTFKFDGETVRIAGIDAPEFFRSRCEDELVLGLKAKERLRALLDLGSIRVEREGHDRYGRTLGRVTANGFDVGARLLAEGFALEYKPGRDAKLARLRVWCGRSAQLDDSLNPIPVPKPRPTE